MTDTSITSSRPLCVRAPKCRRPAHPGHRGMCRPHYDQFRAANPPVPAGPVASHVTRLRAAGLGWQRIAELTGVSFACLRHLPAQRYVLSENAARILAVPIPPVAHQLAADGALVDATGTRRRIQALVAAGWPNLILADEMGYHPAQFGRGLLDDTASEWVRASVARRAVDVFNRLHMATPPDTLASRRSRLRGRRRGWAPPLAWDDDTIDNPDATPNLGDTGRVDFAAIIADHRYLGRTDDQIARTLGMKPSSLQRQLQRHGITPSAVRVAS